MLPDFNQHLLPLPLPFFLVGFLSQFIRFVLHIFDMGGINNTGNPYMTARIVISGVACPHNSLCIIEFPL